MEEQRDDVLVIENDSLPDADEEKILVITNEDLKEVTEPFPSFPGLKTRTLTVHKKETGVFQRGSNTAASTIAGFLGGFLAWLILEPFVVDGLYKNFFEVLRETIVFDAVLGGCIGLFLGAYEEVMNRRWQRAIKQGLQAFVLGMAGGGLGGAFGQVLYSLLLSTANAEIPIWLLIISRTLSWGLSGLFVGLGQSAGSGSSQKIKNGVLGGLIGGLIGGFLFDIIGSFTEGGELSRAVGLSIIGFSLGMAISTIEELRKEAWLYITGGLFKGKQFILYKPTTIIGSSIDCDITIFKDPGVAPQHVKLQQVGNSRQLIDLTGGTTKVFGRPVRQKRLESGDEITIGNTTMVYYEKALKVLSAFLLVAFGAFNTCDAQPAAVVQMVKPAVVDIQTGSGNGSGVIINPDGLVLTCSHVVTQRQAKVKLASGQEVRGQKVFQNQELDIAVLRLEVQNLPSIRLGNSNLTEGETVYVLGSPLGMSQSISKGIVSSSKRQINGREYIQTDAAVNPGNSGGPLINEAGEMVGIVSARVKNAEGIGLAIPINQVVELLKDNGYSFETILEEARIFTRRQETEKQQAGRGNEWTLYYFLIPSILLLSVLIAWLVKKRKKKVDDIEIILH